MRTDANIHETDGGNVTIALPGTFDHYHVRRELIIQRNASKSPEQRERINLLLAQLENYERAEGELRANLAQAIKRQMALL